MQPVPQAEPGMRCSAHGHIPPHSTHPFPVLLFVCSSLAKTPLSTMPG